MTSDRTASHNDLRRATAWIMVLLALATVTTVSLWCASHTAAGWLWAGAALRAQVAERLSAISSPNGLPVGAYQPTAPLSSWRIVSAQAASNAPLWRAISDDDPTYALTVNLEVEYANGQRAQLQWTTWRYGLVFGPLVLSLGNGPDGELMRLPDAATP